MKRKEVAIIGYGRFGQFAAEHLKRDFRVFVVESRRTFRLARNLKSATIEEAALKEVIVLAVPINKLRNLLQRLSPLVSNKTLVLDVCSVKIQPLRWMKELLPHHCYTAGLHPLFGPDSASGDLHEKNIVLCPGMIPARKLASLRSYLRSLGLHIHETTPTHHDQMMARTLFLTQFIGHSLHRLPLSSTPLTTANYEMLKRVADTTSNDTRELFRDMYKYNTFARAIPNRLISDLQRTAKLLSKRSK